MQFEPTKTDKVFLACTTGVTLLAVISVVLM